MNAIQHEQLKQELLALAEEALEATLQWDVEHPERTFAEIETFVLHTRRKLGQRLAQALCEHQGAHRPVPGPRCPNCQREMHYKGQRRRQVGSLVAAVEFSGSYYVCEHCEQQCVFPLAEQLDLPEPHWSAGVVRRVVWLSGKFSYGDVAAVLEEEGEVAISKSTLWQLAQRWGQRIGAEVAAEETQVKAAARAWSTPQGHPPTGKKGVAVDGAMLNLIDEGWKEFKVGCVFDVAPVRRTDRRTGDYAEFGHATALSYCASLQPAGDFGWQVWTEAQRRGWEHALEQLVLGDGAGWIWNLRDEHFPGSATLVDWYHATEHLGTAKAALYPQASAAASQWYHTMERHLFQGQADRVAAYLTQAQLAHQDTETVEALRQAAQYFANNQRRMQYQALRDAGWPIGSGMVESGAKQFKQRFTAAGMRWSRQGAENLLPVRAAVMTSKARFDDLWGRALQNSPLN